MFETARPKPIELREYQKDAVRNARLLIKEGIRRILIIAPTGAGKTVVFAHIIAGAITLGSPCLVIAHRRELIDQTVRKVLAAGVPAEHVGVIMANDSRRNPRALVQVASVDTLRNRRPLPPAKLVVIDECHRALANSYVQIAEGYPDAVHLGFTATPWRLDGKGLGRFYSEPIVVATVQQLIEEGFLVRPRVFSHPERTDLTGVTIRGGDYNEEQLAVVVKNDRRRMGNIVEHWHRHAAGLRTLAFAVDVEDSIQMAEAFRASGVTAEHLDGTTAIMERKAILHRFTRGETLVVTNCAVLTEGYDEPLAKCCILARPTKSRTLYFQRVGRVLRVIDGQPEITSAIILDHEGSALEHGLPQDPQEYSLEDASKRKKSSGSISFRTCERCYAALPSGTLECPECGFVFPVETREIREVDGDLVEIRRAQEELVTELRHRIHRIAGQIDGSRAWTFGETNRRLFNRYRKSRQEMGAIELRAVLAYLESGQFATDNPVPVRAIEPPPSPARAPVAKRSPVRPGWLDAAEEVVDWKL